MTGLIKFWDGYLGLWAVFAMVHAVCIWYLLELLEPKYNKSRTFYVWFGAALAYNTFICLPGIADIWLIGSTSFGLYIIPVLLVFKDALWKKLIAYLTIFITMGIEEFLIYLIIVHAYDNPYTYESMSSYHMIMLFGLPILLSCQSVFVLIWRSSFGRSSKTLSSERIGMMFVLSAQWTLFLLVGGIMLKYNVLPYSVVIVSITAVVISLGGVVWLVKTVRGAVRRTEESELLQRKLDLCEKRQAERDEQFESLRRIKHDFRNHMQIISGLAAEKRYDEIYRYTDELLEDYK